MLLRVISPIGSLFQLPAKSVVDSKEMSEQSKDVRPRWWSEWGIAAFLFLGTAAVVVWQNSRLGVLWDLSYILENSYRISLGDIPYRDFPFPYAPLTFLVQATIIKMWGRVFWHHILYCAISGGLGTVLTWRIVLNLLRDTVSRARLVAFLLVLPLTILGIYCIYPHPFYDPDSTFVILLCILLLQRLERKAFPSLPTFLTGGLLVAPLFLKQNTGLAFLCSAVGMLVVLIGSAAWRRRPIRGYVLLICGAVVGLALVLTLIHFTAGLANYERWTIKFAAERRTPSLRDMLSVYQDRALLLWLPFFVLGVVLLWLKRKGKRLLALLSICLMSVPFAWPACYLLRDTDASERAERLLSLWPFVLILSSVFALLAVRRRKGITSVLPLILVGTVLGAFLSQQLWGSTYALWPLWIILGASIILGLVELLKDGATMAIVPLTAVIAVSLVVAGAFYLRSHERLQYADLSEGKLVRSQLPQLRGLSIRGSWLPDFEELVRYTDKEIPREDGILMIPGEDLFYYTTGRRPRFPVLMFDRTVNPYSAEEILAEARARDIRWLVIKDGIQLEEEPLENKDHLFELLRQDFRHIESLNNYEILKRRVPGDKEDEQDDNSEQGNEDSDSPSDR